MRADAQRVLSLCTKLRRAFAAGDKKVVRDLSCGPLMQVLRLLRPTEISMILNQWARMRMDDEQAWMRVSEVLPELLVDPDSIAVAVTVNAYAKASWRHDAAFAAVSMASHRLLDLEIMQIRAASMIINSYSKVRVEDPELFLRLGDRVAESAAHISATDLANVLNGFARFAMQHPSLFEALREPMLQVMKDFNTQHLAALLHAHASLRLRDEEMLNAMATRLWEECSSGSGMKPVSGNHLSSIVQAYAQKLDFSPELLVRVVEFSLPMVVHEMRAAELVLTVPVLSRLQGLKATSEFCEPVFKRCLAIVDDLTHPAFHAIACAAAHFHYYSVAFWSKVFLDGASRLEDLNWEASRIVSIAEVAATVWVAAAVNPTSAEALQQQKEAIFKAISSQLAARHEDFDAEARAKLSVSYHMAGEGELQLVGQGLLSNGREEQPLLHK